VYSTLLKRLRLLKRGKPGFSPLFKQRPSPPRLATVDQEIYARPLTHDQAGVAWTWYRIRKARLAQTTRRLPRAWRLLRQLQRVPMQSLPRFGTHLYRLQHNGLASLPSHEWAALWEVYREQRATLPVRLPVRDRTQTGGNAQPLPHPEMPSLGVGGPHLALVSSFRHLGSTFHLTPPPR